MPTPKAKDSNDTGKHQTKIAIIGSVTTLLVAIVTGLFGLIQANWAKRNDPPPTPIVAPLQNPAPLQQLATPTPTEIQTATATAIPTASPTLSLPTPLPAATEAMQPTIEIVGPATIPLGKKSYFTFISTHAQRAEWNVGGFADNKTFVIEPLAQSHQIFLEPTDSSRIDDNFTLIVTVFGEDGKSATATYQIQVTEDKQ